MITTALAIIFLVSTIVLSIVYIRSTTQSNSVNYVSKSVEGKFKKAAVATENSLCAEVGRNILLAGGNAAEAAISALLCIGVVHPHLSGLGGGFLMTIYNR